MVAFRNTRTRRRFNPSRVLSNGRSAKALARARSKPKPERFNPSRWSRTAIERTILELADHAGFDPLEAFEERSAMDWDAVPDEAVSLSFAGELPAEIREGIEGLGAAVRMAFRSNVSGGGGEDCMSRIGADAMIEHARGWASRGVSGAAEYLEQMGAPGCGLALFLFRARDGAMLSELPPILEVDTPPMGARFELCGECFTVGESGGSPYAVADLGGGFELPDRIPVDAGSVVLLGEDDGSDLPPF